MSKSLGNVIDPLDVVYGISLEVLATPHSTTLYGCGCQWVWVCLWVCLWVWVCLGVQLCVGLASVHSVQGLHKMLEDTNLDPKEIGRAKAGQVSGRVQLDISVRTCRGAGAV